MFRITLEVPESFAISPREAALKICAPFCSAGVVIGDYTEVGVPDYAQTTLTLEEVRENIYVGARVIVSDPKHNDSAHLHSFSGFVEEFDEELITVRDGDNNGFDVEYDEVVAIDEED